MKLYLTIIAAAIFASVLGITLKYGMNGARTSEVDGHAAHTAAVDRAVDICLRVCGDAGVRHFEMSAYDWVPTCECK